jgi:hypothetical protein
MKSPRSIGVVAALAVVLVVAVFWYVAPKMENKEAKPTQAPTPREAGATILLTLTDGRTVSVPDFTYNRPQIDAEEVTYVLLTQTPEGVEEDARYGIVFGTDSTFTIGLFSEPLGENRTIAEAKLIELLGLPQNALCKLDISIGVPDTIEGPYKGKNLGVSFCPGSVSLP